MIFSKPATSRQIDLAVLALRVMTGATMAAHGYQKVFTMGVSQLTGGFTSMGIPMASLSAPLVAYLELVGGILLIGGISHASSRIVVRNRYVRGGCVRAPEKWFLRTNGRRAHASSHDQFSRVGNYGRRFVFGRRGDGQ